MAGDSVAWNIILNYRPGVCSPSEKVPRCVAIYGNVTAIYRNRYGRLPNHGGCSSGFTTAVGCLIFRAAAIFPKNRVQRINPATVQKVFARNSEKRLVSVYGGERVEVFHFSQDFHYNIPIIFPLSELCSLHI